MVSLLGTRLVSVGQVVILFVACAALVASAVAAWWGVVVSPHVPVPVETHCYLAIPHAINGDLVFSASRVHQGIRWPERGHNDA